MQKKIKMAIVWRLNNAYVHFKKVLSFKLHIIKKGPICYVQMNKIKDYLHVKVGLKKPKTKLCSLDNSAYLTPLGTFSFKTFYFRDEIRMIHARTYSHRSQFAYDVKLPSYVIINILINVLQTYIYYFNIICSRIWIQV